MQEMGIQSEKDNFNVVCICIYGWPLAGSPSGLLGIYSLNEL